MKRRVVLHCPLGYCLLLGIFISGCSRSAAPDQTGQPAATPGQVIIGVSLWTVDDPWRAQMKADIEAAAAKHAQLKLLIKDARDDAERQRADVREFTAQHVKLLIVSPKNAQVMTEPVAQAIAAGIPVILLDRSVVGDKYTCLIHPNNQQIGTAAGVWLAQKLNGKGKIAEIKGPVDSLPNAERLAAFQAQLRHPGYRFVFSEPVDLPRIDAAKLMGEALQRSAEINAVYAYTDEAGRAAYEAAKVAHRNQGTLFIGIGGLPNDGQAWVRQGILSVSFLRPTGGAEAIQTALKVLAGETVPQTIVLDTRVFTKENVDQGGAPPAMP